MATEQRRLDLDAWRRLIEHRLTRLEILVYVLIALQLAPWAAALAGVVLP